MKKARLSQQVNHNIDNIYFADLAMVLIVVFFLMTTRENEHVIDVLHGVDNGNCDYLCSHGSHISITVTDNGYLKFHYLNRTISIYEDRQASNFIQAILAEHPTNTVWLFVSEDVKLKHTIAASILLKNNGINRVVWNAL